MSDVVHDAADKEITRLARLMAKEFKAAHKDMAKRLEKKLAAYERELIQWQKDLKAGKRTEKEFKAWKSARCADLGRTQGLTEALANDLVQADQRATEHIRSALPAVYAENYNYGSYQVQQGRVVPTFALYDEGTVANLLDEDKQLLPAPRVNIPKDMSWNASHVRSALTQSFLTGESIPDMAKRLRGVADMNARSAIRIARTAITGTENRARVDSYVSANDMGIQCEKQWMAALDGRTRDSHRALDGEHVKPDEVFDNGCRFPGDPQAPASEVYNCRCTLVAYIPEHNTMKGRSDATVGSLSYEEWKAGVREQQPEPASGRSLEKFLELPSVQKRIKASGMSKKKLTDAMREEMQNQGFKDLRAFKTLPKSGQQGVLKDATELLRKGTNPRRDVKPCNKALLHSQINYVERHGGKIEIADEHWLSYMDKKGAAAINYGDSIVLRPDASTSEVLEEVFHFKQHKRGDYAELPANEVRLRREIDAQKYLLSVSKQYKIQSKEIELTRKNLKDYEEELRNLIGGDNI